MIEPLIAHLTTPTLADKAIGLSSSKAEGLALMIVGMTVVFIALVLVGATLVAIRKFTEPPTAGPKPAPKPEAQPAAPHDPAESRIDARTLAVLASAAATAVTESRIDTRTVAMIAAAATAVVGAPVRVRRVQRLRRGGHNAWAASGRSRPHRSHNIPQRKR